jgi:membrane-bound lytic murein transglycosylase D
MWIPAAKHVIPAMACFLIMWHGLVPSLSATPKQHETRAPEDFPLFDVIIPNVNFWIDIFTVYDKSQGVIHDFRDLDRVYGVIELDPARTAQAAKRNNTARKQAVDTYQKILLDLADGMPASSRLEKQVAALFAPGTAPDDYRDAAKRIRCQTGIRERFRAGLIRSGAMIDEFRRIFISYGLPGDLVYLPAVESSFDYQAYSKTGAAGVWQFMRSTGKEFMHIDYVVDQRRDPFISADAAARLLKRNHAELQDWAMAITAYNHGLGGMKRARQALGTYENIFLHYHSRTFKFASRNFYPEFLAARHVAQNCQKYFGELIFEKPRKMTRFQTAGYLCARTFVRNLQLDMDEFQILNPSLRSPVFNDQKFIPKGFVISLPHHISKTSAMAATSGIYQARQKPSRFHVVKKGDTAGTVARTHNVPLNDLITANGLNRRAVIYIGQNLRIPSAEPAASLPPLDLATREPALKPLDAQRESPTPRTIARKVTKPSQVQPAVSVPDTAEAPGSDNGTSEAPGSDMGAMDMPRVLAQAAGEAEAIPVPKEAWINPLADLSNLKIRQITRADNTRTGIIQVEAEETLGHYADWLEIPTRRIRALNNLPFGTSISLNQTIKLPLSEGDPERFEEKRFEFHREIEEDFFAFYRVTGVETYEVRPGDSIWQLCFNQLEIPFWLLKKFNPDTDFNTMRPGHTLQYPVVVGTREELDL